MNAETLRLNNVSVQFGGVRAVNNVNIELYPGEFVGLIGPNGAGKTTIFNLITSSIRPTTGEIFFAGKNIVGTPPDQIFHLGISRTFQNIRLFPQMSVFENVALGLHSRPRYSLAEAFIRTRRAQQAEKSVYNEALALLERVGLHGYAAERASSLSYGLQRRLELARAMAASPQLLLLDEPAAGMNEDECAELVQLIRQIQNEKHYTTIMIEHHMNVVMELCANSRIYVLNLGEILACGSPAEIQSNPAVIKAYLGEKRSRHVRQ